MKALTGMGLLSLALVGMTSLPPPAIGQTSTPEVSSTRNQPNLKALVDEVWQLVDRSYVDPGFNRQNWQSVRQKYLSQTYASPEAAYRAIEEMLALLGDPFTRFMDPESFKAMQVDPGTNTAGVGLQVSRDSKTQTIIIFAPIDDSPAAEAGLQAGDGITAIDGKSTAGMTANAAAQLLRGQPGSFVRLSLLRDGQPQEVQLQRRRVVVKPLRYRLQTTPIGPIGYLRLSQFTAEAVQSLRAALLDLERQKSIGYILDLRANPGGLLYAASDIGRLWLSKGTIFTTVGRKGEIDRFQADRRAVTNKPLVVLIDGGSASASEIVAAALQENQRATLVGTQTLGNNLIQSVRMLQEGSGIAVTIAKWLTPQGKDINKVGLKPDIVVALTPAQKQNLTRNRDKIGTPADPQYVAALNALLRQIQTAKEHK